MDALALAFGQSHFGNQLSTVETGHYQQQVPPIFNITGAYETPLYPPRVSFVPNVTLTSPGAFNPPFLPIRANGPLGTTAAPIPAAQYPIPPNQMPGMVNPPELTHSFSERASQNHPQSTRPNRLPHYTSMDNHYVDLMVPAIYWRLPAVNGAVPPQFGQCYIERDIALLSKICRQVDYYFSDGNLLTDWYLKGQMDEEGWVKLSAIARFHRIAALTPDLSVIATALHFSAVVEVDGARTHVRRRENPTIWVNQQGNVP